MEYQLLVCRQKRMNYYQTHPNTQQLSNYSHPHWSRAMVNEGGDHKIHLLKMAHLQWHTVKFR